jgi:hypothetical protein
MTSCCKSSCGTVVRTGAVTQYDFSSDISLRYDSHQTVDVYHSHDTILIRLSMFIVLMIRFWSDCRCLSFSWWFFIRYFLAIYAFGKNLMMLTQKSNKKIVSKLVGFLFPLTVWWESYHWLHLYARRFRSYFCSNLSY